MANFWAGFGQGFSGGFKRSWDAAARRRERKEDREQALADLESSREYAEDVYDKRERDKRAREGAAASASLLMQMERSPEAKKRLLGEATEKRGIGPSPEGVEQTDFTGGRILREEGDVVGALRDMRLEEKAALSKHLKLKSAFYEDRVKEAVSNAKVYGEESSVNPESAKRGMKRILEKYKDDPRALSRFNSAFNSGASSKRTAIAIPNVIAGKEHEEEFTRQQPYIEGMLYDIYGAQKEGVLQRQSRETFNGGGVKKLESQWADINKVEGLIDILDSKGIDHDFTRNTLPSVVETFVNERLEPEAKTAAQKNLKVLLDAQKKFEAAKTDDEKSKAKDEFRILSALIGDYKLGVNEDGSFNVYKPSDGSLFLIDRKTLPSGGTSTIFVPKDNSDAAIKAAEDAARLVEENRNLTVNVHEFGSVGGDNNGGKGKDDDKVLDLSDVGQEKKKDDMSKKAKNFVRSLSKEDQNLFLNAANKKDAGEPLSKEEEKLLKRWDNFLNPAPVIPPLPIPAMRDFDN